MRWLFSDVIRNDHNRFNLLQCPKRIKQTRYNHDPLFGIDSYTNQKAGCLVFFEL